MARFTISFRIIYLVASFSVLFFIGILVSSFLLSKNGSSTSHEKDLETYTVTKFSKNGNMRHVGFMTSPSLSFVSGDDFLTYYDSESESYVLISLFGEQQYFCTGSCYCSDNEYSENRRTTSRVLEKGISFLIASATSALVYTTGKNYFEKECAIKFSEECPKEKIRAIVDDCEDFTFDIQGDDDVIDGKKKAKEKEEEEGDGILTEEEEEFFNNMEDDLGEEGFFSGEEEGDDEEEEDFNSDNEYLCRGRCYDNTRIKEPSALEEVEKKNCRRMRKEGTLSLNIDVFEDENEKVNEVFMEKILRPFCKSNSIFEYKKESGKVSKRTGKPLMTKRKVQLCVGALVDWRTKEKSNLSIKCLKIRSKGKDALNDENAEDYLLFRPKSKKIVEDEVVEPDQDEIPF